MEAIGENLERGGSDEALPPPNTVDPSARDKTGSTPKGKHEPRADAMAIGRKRGIYERYFKSTIDVAVGIFLTVVTLPVVVAVAMYVLVSMGRPILYREERVGRYGRVFRMNRFRTMRITESHEEEDFESRILPAGRFLRRWSLDEIPQLWNIAAGNMSLVGPRPERTYIVDGYEDWEHRRHQVKPGATGLWQITARGDGRHMHEHVKIDLDYVDRLSLLYDLRIMLKTVGVVLNRPEKPSLVPGVIDTVALPRRTWREATYLFAKRLIDLLTSALLLLVLSPALLVIAVVIKLESPGPVLFRQVRVGHRGRLFRIVKFRSMTEDASEDLHREHYEALGALDTSEVIKLDDDPRITRIGTFLRGWSLDELPNLWNVFRGEMSLVGPRPIVPYELDLYSTEHMRRLDAKPGITGMAQVEGRTEISLERRIAYDLEYVDRRSAWFDFLVALRTFRTVFTTRGA